MESVEKKPQVESLKRIGEKKFSSYEEAKSFQANSLVGHAKKFDKSKVVARYDGTFDLIWYLKPEAEKPKAEETKVEEPKQHGLTAKQRRAKEKKQ